MTTRRGLQGLLTAGLLITAATARAELTPDQARAREIFNQGVYGDPSGSTVAENSALARASKACGAKLEVWDDFASMPPSEDGTVDYCDHAVATFETLCTSHNFAPAMSKLVHRIECRYDGKHDPGTSDMELMVVNMAQDMELKNGVFTVHMRKGHVNVDDVITRALERDLRAHHDLQAAGLLPYQITSRKKDNMSLYGNESGKSIDDDSVLARVKQACGTKPEVTVDYASLTSPDRQTAGGCVDVIEALISACAEPAYRPTLTRLQKIECLRDGKHPSNNQHSTPEDYKWVSQDMELTGSRLVYHGNPGHANLGSAFVTLLNRMKKK